MKALLAVLVVFVVLVVAMTLALTWLSNRYDELIGRPRSERRVPWLRSMRAEAEGHIESRVGITALERIVMVSVYIAVVTLLVWLIFFAGSSVPPQLRGPG
jgi:small neutral amino acid transporter SnatA (MarC family)